MDAKLTKLKEGDTAIIKQIKGGSRLKIKVLSMGIQIGKKIKLLSSQPFEGPIVIKIGSIEMAVGRGIANNIIVKK